MTDLGSDFSRAGGDLTADMRLLSSPTEEIVAWLENQAERLQTPRGALWYDKNYGLDIRSYVSDDEEPAVAAHEINQELLKDERTARASTDVLVSADSWTLTSTVTHISGKRYNLTLAVSAVSVELLRAEAV